MAFGEDAGQCQGNLLGRPALAQKVAHHPEQNAIAMELAQWAALQASALGAGTRCGAGVASGLGVAPQFPADGAGGSPQDQGDISNRVLLLDKAGQRHAVFRLELLISSWRCALHLRTLLGSRCCTSGLNPPTASALLLNIQSETALKQASSDELDSIRLLKLFEGFSFEEPHYWPSLLRNAINYRPGYSYRSIPKHNFLSFDFVKKPLGADKIESMLAEAERLKAQLKGVRNPTEMPNEAALLLAIQTCLIELCVTKGLDILCAQNGFQNTPLKERRQFAKVSISMVNTVSRGLAF